MTAQHEQPRNDDQDGHGAADPLYALTFQLDADTDCCNGEASIWKDKCPPDCSQWKINMSMHKIDLPY